MKIVPLGINGFFPTFGRHTTSFLVLNGSDAIVLDAGTGISRLTEPEIRNALPAGHLSIILSHYHLDHVIGLSYLVGILPDIQITIYAPAQPFVDADPFIALHRLFQPPFFSLPLENFPVPPQIIPITTSRLKIGQSEVVVRKQKHPGGSIGIRVADMVFMTDTIVDESAVDFVRGAGILLHEVWLSDDELPARSHELAGHSFAGGVVDLAQKSGVRRMMPIHLHPHRSPQRVASLVSGMKRDGLEVIVPVEGEIYSAI